MLFEAIFLCHSCLILIKEITLTFMNFQKVIRSQIILEILIN